MNAQTSKLNAGHLFPPFWTLSEMDIIRPIPGIEPTQLCAALVLLQITLEHICNLPAETMHKFIQTCLQLMAHRLQLLWSHHQE